MSIAALTAQKSKDPSSQIGAVLVKDRRVISMGYNGLPQGVSDPNDWPNLDNCTAPETLMRRNERPEKYHWFEHAERNCLYNIARQGGVSALGSTMYCACGVPCTDCARGICNSGVGEVVYLDVSYSNKWEEAAERSLVMFCEAGVKTRVYKGPKVGAEILSGGKLITI